ncbi:MAG: oxygen-independent coproporphyrinogen III oxidase [Gammaproteobacteria bacterium]
MQTTAVFDSDLIQRYDRQGPRYTSYPTAVQFQESFGEDEYRDAVAVTNGDLIPAPLSLYFHIPFCATVCYYCACNKVVTANRARAEQYLQRLLKEVARQGALFDRSREVEQLHWGGGTPTYLSREQMQRLMQATREHFTVSEDGGVEFSIEIDPRTVSAEDVAFLRELGFNRVSLGVQDFDRRVQAAVNRIQPAEQTMAVIDAARAARFRSISIDLIYGLPLQTVASFDRTLEQVIEAAPDRISVFNYAHLPHMFKVQRQIQESQLPEPAQKLNMLAHTVERLTAAGYVYIGMDHFALPQDELAVEQREGRLSRNFQGYSTHDHCDIVGLGVSAIGRIGNVYCQNERELARYQARIDEGGLAVFRGVELNNDDELRRAVIMQLICNFELDTAAVEERFGIRFSRYFADELRVLEGMQADGLLRIDGARIEVLPRGRLLIRNVCMVFDRYLTHHGDDRPRYSRVV